MKLNTKNGFDFGTNILDVEVPKALRTRIKTGVEYIDGSFGGQGITPSSVTLFTGTPGAGKTTMMLKLVDSLVGNGAIGVFNTGEESLYQVKLTAERLRLKNGFAVGEEIHVPTLLEKCDEIRAKNPNKQFVLVWTASRRWTTASTPTDRPTAGLRSVPCPSSRTGARRTTPARS